MNRSRLVGTTLGLCMSLIGAPSGASEGLKLLCPMLEHQASSELDDLRLDADLAVTDERVAGELHEQIEGLWNNGSVEEADLPREQTSERSSQGRGEPVKAEGGAQGGLRPAPGDSL